MGRIYVLTPEPVNLRWIDDAYYSHDLDELVAEAIRNSDHEPIVLHAEHPALGFDLTDALRSAIVDEISDDNGAVGDLLDAFGDKLTQAEKLIADALEGISQRCWKASDRAVDRASVLAAIERVERREDGES